MDEASLLAERARLSTTLRALKTGAAEISQLLAGGVFGGEEWDRAVRVLAECRAVRKRLDDDIHQIDNSLTSCRDTASATSSVLRWREAWRPKHVETRAS